MTFTRPVLAAAAAVFALIAAKPAQAQFFQPFQMALREGAQDYMHFFGQSNCLYDVTVTSSDPSKVLVYAIDMQTGQPLPGGGASANVQSTNDQGFLVMGAGSVTMTSATSVKITWDGSQTSCPVSGPGPMTMIQYQADPTTAGARSHKSSDLGDPIDAEGGEIYVPHAGFLRQTDPMGLEFRPYYAAQILSPTIQHTMGNGWRHGFEWIFRQTGLFGVEVETPSGRIVRFERGFFDPAWHAAAFEEIPFQLTQSGQQYALLDPRTGRTVHFDLTKVTRPIRIEDGRGNEHTLSYDMFGRILQATDGRGRTLTYGYGGNPVRLVSVSDSIRSVALAYDSSGRLVSITDENGDVTDYVYAAGAGARLERIVRPLGNAPYVQTFDSQGRVVQQTDALGNALSVAYDPTTHETTGTDPLGNAWVHAHGQESELTSWKDPTSQSATMSYDTQGRRKEVVDRLGARTSIDWHVPSAKPAGITGADGSQTSFSYMQRTVNGLDHYDLSGVTRADGTTEAFAHDAQGNVVSHTDPAGKLWSYAWANGLPTAATNPKGGLTQWTYNADRTPATVTDHAGNTTGFGYDPIKRLDRIDHADGTVETFAYDGRDRLVLHTDELNNSASRTFDDNGNTTSLTNFRGKTWLNGFDAMDRRVSTTDPLSHQVQGTYDELGRPKTTTDAAGNTTTYAYDSVGNLASVTDPTGAATSYGYDAERVLASFTDALSKKTDVVTDDMGRPVEVKRPSTATTRMTYDAMGRTTSVENALGEVTDVAYEPRGLVDSVALVQAGISASYTYDDLGNRVQIDDPRGFAWKREYDAQGRRTKDIDPIGNEITYQYDQRNRVSQMGLPGGGSVQVTRDAKGRVTRLLYGDGTDLTYTWNENGQLTGGNGISLAYDDRGDIVDSNGIAITRGPRREIASITFEPGKTVQYGYDARGLPISIADWLGNSAALVWDANRRLTAIQRSNGVDTSYTYDADDRVIEIVDTDPTDIVVSQISLVRDLKGQITSANRNQPQAGTPQLELRSFSFNGASQVNGFAYNGLGSLLNDGIRTYSWNQARQLLGYQEGAKVVTYGRDALGYMNSRTEGGLSRDFTRNFALLGRPIAVERQGGENRKFWIQLALRGGAEYIRTLESRRTLWEILWEIDAATGQAHFHHHDESGNVIFTSNGAGQVANRYAYGAYGTVLAQQVTHENSFTYRGAQGLFQDGQLYLWQRGAYDSVTARSISRNPSSADPKGINPYTSARGNPLSDGNALAAQFTEKLWTARARLLEFGFWGSSAGIGGGVDAALGDAGPGGLQSRARYLQTAGWSTSGTPLAVQGSGWVEPGPTASGLSELLPGSASGDADSKKGRRHPWADAPDLTDMEEYLKGLVIPQEWRRILPLTAPADLSLKRVSTTGDQGDGSLPTLEVFGAWAPPAPSARESQAKFLRSQIHHGGGSADPTGGTPGYQWGDASREFIEDRGDYRGLDAWMERYAQPLP